MSGTMILLIILAVAGFGTMMLYNRLVALRQNRRQAFSDVDVQLKQRYDLVPQLVDIGEGLSPVLAQGDEAVVEHHRAEAGDGEKMAAAFYENKMLILIASRHNHFEPANIYVPAADPSSIINMKREVGEILSIIDKLALYDPKVVEQQRQAAAAR